MGGPDSSSKAAAAAAKEHGAALSNQLFLGSFVHSKTLHSLEYLHNTAVCVDKAGTIVAIERECDGAKATELLFPKLGWSSEDVTVHTIEDGQFYFPGFIGNTHTHIHTLSHSLSHISHISLSHTHTYTHRS